MVVSTYSQPNGTPDAPCVSRLVLFKWYDTDSIGFLTPGSVDAPASQLESGSFHAACDPRHLYREQNNGKIALPANQELELITSGDTCKPVYRILSSYLNPGFLIHVSEVLYLSGLPLVFLQTCGMNALAVVGTLVSKGSVTIVRLLQVGLSLQHVTLAIFIENKISLPLRQVREVGNETPQWYISYISILVIKFHSEYLPSGGVYTETSSSPSSDYQLSYLFYLPYESTEVLANRYYLTMPPVEVSSTTGSYVTILDDDLKARLGTATSIPRGIPFMVCHEPHAQAAKDLLDVFLDAEDESELAELALTVRDHVNEALYIFALYGAVYERPDISSADLPRLETVLTDQFVPTDVINKAKRLVKAASIHQDTDTVHVYWQRNSTGLATRNSEQRVAYWREDLHLNSFHWHWHKTNPFSIEPGKRDRRGELFYYMHHNLVARYNFERLGVGLKPAEPFEDWRAPVQEGYFPHLTLGNGYEWGNRQDNTLMQDVIGTGMTDALYISNLELWRTHLLYSVDEKYLISENGSQIRLTDDPSPGEQYGIDLVGEAMEAGASVNPLYYGSIHNKGHMLLDGCNDPDQKHMGHNGVMAATGTAVRDPVFFRWHGFVDKFFHKYKMTQPPYTPDQLSVGVEVLEVKTPNELHTFFTNRTFVASHGIDFQVDPKSNISVLLTSDFLNHTDFTYHIKVNNTKTVDLKPKVRIFLAPKVDEEEQQLTYASLLRYWAEMDVFEADPIAPGVSNITRLSSESSITSNDVYQRTNISSPSANANFPGCQWPQNLLLPRGKPDGMAFRLFVMITDADQDKPLDGGNDPPPSFCTFCGIPGARYPDRWPMGYPLDRKSTYGTIDDFADAYSNMEVVDVIIYHAEEPEEEEHPEN
ncbi:hemocyanin F chain-like [Penaeus indicus]|uniref:hemocyanin F chain-like n=1 Tax=Penaeus indicus TaxID=29960 RepID=UPI00300D06AD